MKKKMLKLKLTLDTVLSGGSEVKRKRWSIKKRIPLTVQMSKKMTKKLKKLTKLMGLFVLATAMLTTVGCGRRAGYTEPEEVAVVSAMGVDSSETGVRVSLQTVAGGSTSVVKAEGESVELALSELYGSGSKRYELSHCALVVLGDGLGSGRVFEVYDFCESVSELSDAVLLVSTHDALSLLSLEGAAGYDIASAMRSYPDGAGLFSRNRFYEIKSAEKTAAGASVMALPYFYVSENEYTLWGLKLYRGRTEKTLLDRRESAIYLMLRGIFTSGRIEYGADAVTVSGCRTDIRDNIVRCRLTVDEELTEGEKNRIVGSLETGAKELYDQMTNRYGDLFFLGTDNKELEFKFEIGGYERGEQIKK